MDWSNEMFEALINANKEFIYLCEFNAIHFNVDKVKLYEELRKHMAKNIKEDFGPEQALQPLEQISAMDKEEFKIFKDRAEADKVNHIRIQQNKRKEQRSSSRLLKAVQNGTKSRSRQIVFMHNDEQGEIRGGSPSMEVL